METKLKNKKILITGACGTVGRELVRQFLLDFHVKELVAVDNNETGLFFLEEKYRNYRNVGFYLADVRDQRKMMRVMEGVHIVFHAAAYKHVILCERSPFESVQTNILGVQNIIIAASKNNVEKVIFTSSDKAVNPTNVMGTSKLMGERLMTAANNNSPEGKTVFASTRFGNVLGSRGSVIPIFRKQIRNGGPVTLTDEGMTRFIMSIKEAVQLVIDSAFLSCGGEVFITKMPVIRIKDLAEVMVDELSGRYGYDKEDVRIEIIGSKPGEKMYEELMNYEETRRTLELDRYFITKPAFSSLNRNIQYDYPEIVSRTVSAPYNSENQQHMTKEKLRAFLDENDLLYENDDEDAAFR